MIYLIFYDDARLLKFPSIHMIVSCGFLKDGYPPRSSSIFMGMFLDFLTKHIFDTIYGKPHSSNMLDVWLLKFPSNRSGSGWIVDLDLGHFCCHRKKSSPGRCQNHGWSQGTLLRTSSSFWRGELWKKISSGVKRLTMVIWSSKYHQKHTKNIVELWWIQWDENGMIIS